MTFRQQDSLPQGKLDEIKSLRREWELKHPEPRSESSWEAFAREYSRRADIWLDEGYGSCHFSNRENVSLLAEALLKFHGKRYHTGSYAIMPNHCHLLIRPFEGENLERLLKGIKGSVSRAILNQQGRSGENLWQQESHDRIVRDSGHLGLAIQYIGQNPLKAGFSHEQGWRRWISEDWVEAGWHFGMLDETVD